MIYISADEVDLLALWGAGLSTILFTLKAIEYWKNRFRIDVSYNFTTDENIGNQISIINLSSKPIIIEYIELYYRDSQNIFKVFSKKHSLWSPDDYFISRILPNDKKTFTFSESDYFQWKNKAIFISIKIAGIKGLIHKKLY